MIKKTLYTLFILLALALNVNAQNRYADHSRLAQGKWVKIRVKDAGVYQLTSAALRNMGFSNPAKVSLYGYNVPVMPEAKIENIADDMSEIPLYRKGDGTLLFYSCGTTKWTRDASDKSVFRHFNNPYSSYVYYFLTENAGTPATMPDESIPVPPRTMKAFPDHSIIDNDEFSFINAGRTYFESYDFGTGSIHTYTLHLPGITTGDVTLDVQFGAASTKASSLTLSSGENTLTTINFTPLVDYLYADVRQKSCKWSNVASENPVLKMTYKRSATSSAHLDYIQASYQRSLRIPQQGFLAFRTPDNFNYTAEISGATDGTKVWKVTSPEKMKMQEGKYSAGTYTVNLACSNYDEYVAVNTNATFAAPEIVGTITNQDLHTLSDIDLVIVVPSNGKLTQQAQRLAAAHEKYDGITTCVIPADKLYNEFSAGMPDATAYRRFMKMLYDKAASPDKRPKNILLFGSSLWDNRLRLPAFKNRTQNDYLLCYESDNSVSHTDSYVMEEYFSLLADGKGISPLKERPDCGVGRIPVTNASDAKIVVDKTIDYIANINAGAWKNTVCFLADDGNANQHMKDAEDVISNTSKLYPDFRYKKIYWDSYTRQTSATGHSYPDVTKEINNTMTSGALIMNYTGHGSAYILSHEGVISKDNFASWTAPYPPVWFTAACDVTPFDMNTDNHSDYALLNKTGGAVVFIGTARTVYSSQNRAINRYFMSYVLGNKDDGTHYTIGEALLRGKGDIAARSYSKNDSINKAQYVLLGDPAIRLRTPQYKVHIDRLGGKPIDPHHPETISAGSIITIEGHINDDKGATATAFNGIISPTVYDNEETIVCKHNAADEKGEEDVDPYKYKDNVRVIYHGTDSIRSGKFSFTFPVPMDINYSDLNGLIKLYACNDSHTIEANGTFTDFLIGGTRYEAEKDTIGPVITLQVDGYTKGSIVVTDETPTLYADYTDDSGINTTGNGLGHDIVAIIDNKESTTFTLNSYFQQEAGNYKKGSVTFPLPSPLAPGIHHITMRAFDTLNNMGEKTFEIEVIEGLTRSYRIYDTAGRLITTDNNQPLPRGVYIRETLLTSPIGIVSSKSEKILIH